MSTDLKTVPVPVTLSRSCQASVSVPDADNGPKTHRAKSALEEVQYKDGYGSVLPLQEADGLLLSRNCSPDILDLRHRFQARDDDVVIVTYPKSGTHWVWEIVSMLRIGSGELLSEPIQHIDFLPCPMLAALPSPRVLATHLPVSHLPRDFLSRGCKLILLLRSPLDVAVSYYHFVKKVNAFSYSGPWDGFFNLFLNGHVPYNSWFQHSSEWLRTLDTSPNILLVRYENLHKDFKKEVTRIAEFLHVDVSDDLLTSLQNATSFSNMAHNKFDITLPVSLDGTTCIYRKGEVGDWRNYFTKQQWAQLKGTCRAFVGGHDNRLLSYINDWNNDNY